VATYISTKSDPKRWKNEKSYESDRVEGVLLSFERSIKTSPKQKKP
jgi:hypothetical protein